MGFMGKAGLPACGSADATSAHYTHRASALHESWNMNEPGYYPLVQEWHLHLDGASIVEEPHNQCCERPSSDQCNSCQGLSVMEPKVSQPRTNEAVLQVT